MNEGCWHIVQILYLLNLTHNIKLIQKDNIFDSLYLHLSFSLILLHLFILMYISMCTSVCACVCESSAAPAKR